MSIEVKIPPLPESVSDAVVSAWHKQPGDWVVQDENLVDIETDKVVLEVPAPQAGTLEAIIEEQGATVVAGQVIAKISPEAYIPGESQPSPKMKAPEPPPEPGPSARKLLHEHNLDPAQVPATGKHGRLLKEDILHYLDSVKPPGESGTPISREPEKDMSAVDRITPQPDSREERRVPMSRLRARIAERMLEAQHNAAILTTFNEVNMKPVMDLRQRYKKTFEERHGTRLGLMSFFVRAVTMALQRFPAVNASIDGGDIVYHDFFDIGVAVSSPRGLVVPVLRNTDQINLAEIERRIRDYAARAQTGKLELEELSGGTFSITNGGVFGSMLSTPIINPPQSAILGMHNIVSRPVADNNEVVIRPVMYLALSYDHRIIDGREAVSFLVNVKEMLEDPARILLDI